MEGKKLLKRQPKRLNNSTSVVNLQQRLSQTQKINQSDLQNQQINNSTRKVFSRVKFAKSQAQSPQRSPLTQRSQKTSKANQEVQFLKHNESQKSLNQKEQIQQMKNQYQILKMSQLKKFKNIWLQQKHASNLKTERGALSKQPSLKKISRQKKEDEEQQKQSTISTKDTVSQKPKARNSNQSIEIQNKSGEIKNKEIDVSKHFKNVPSKQTRTRPPSPDSLSVTVAANDMIKMSNELAQACEQRIQMMDYIYAYNKKKKTYPPTLPEFYKFEKFIGKGASSKVVLATHKLTGLKVAIKTINKSRMLDEHSKRKIFQEIFILKKIRNSHVIKIYEVFESKQHLMVVMENAQGGDLLNFVRSRKRLTEQESKQILKQLISGLNVIHKNGVLHRDIKLDNILVNETYSSVKICDFGVSRLMKKGQVVYEHCGTPAYIAPEIVAEQGYSGFGADIWSLGVVLYAMIIGAVPFRAKTLAELQSIILKGKFEIPEWISPESQQLIAGMIELDPDQRLSLEEIENHPWMSSEYTDQTMWSTFMNKFDNEKCPKEPKWDIIDEEVVTEVENLGYDRKYIQNVLKNDEMNHCSTTYALLLFNKYQRPQR